MTRFPPEFEALLSAEGRQLLQGTHPAANVLRAERFFSSSTLLDPAAIAGAAELMTRTFEDLLMVSAKQLPPANGTHASNEESVPKVGRMRAVPQDGPRGTEGQRRAEEIGLLTMFTSASYRRFAEVLAGRALEGPHTGQIFSYQHGDSAGPHTDHHPDEARMKNGYVDVHLTFCTPGIREQSVVYERNGFFSEQRSIAAHGTITAYRLPMWHYTTPLRADSMDERRWLVLASYFDV